MKEQIVKIILVSLITFIIKPALYSQEISIVINNRPNAVIVVKDKDNTQLLCAADILRKYIFKSTNAKLKVVNNIQSDLVNIIIDTKFKNLKYNYQLLDDDGFIIKTVGKNVVISGKSDWGTEYGVYDFLEKIVGVRWLMPTELWTEVKRNNTISFGELNIEDNPKFLSRSFFNVNLENNNAHLSEWGKKNRLRNRIEFHHNLVNLFNSEDIVNSHPQFLPYINGKKYIPKNRKDENWQPNFNVQGIDIYAADQIIKYFKNNPSVSSYSLGVNDSGNFDKRNTDGSKNYLGRDNYSNDYYSWVNRTVRIVNNKLPNKKFGLLAYSRVAEPPRFKLEANIIPFIVNERLMWLDPAIKQKEIELLKTWQGLSKEYGWYDYIYGSIYIVPRVYFKHANEYLIIASEMKVKHYVAEYYPNWIEGPKGWLMCKLLWNPKQNSNELLDDWYASAVGIKSAIYLKQFYQLWETFWTKDILHSSWWKTEQSIFLPFNNQNYINDIPHSLILKADDLLKQAYHNAQTEIQQKRVEDLLLMWEFSKMNYLYFKQKKILNKRILNEDELLIYKKIIKKQDIDKKIEELISHPLYNDVAQRFKRPNWMKY